MIEQVISSYNSLRVWFEIPEEGKCRKVMYRKDRCIGGKNGAYKSNLSWGSISKGKGVHWSQGDTS